jgi:riboflavin biosynthesis pyrimidine reductase
MLTAALSDLDAERLEAAYPWPEASRWLRANMVMTLDGATVGPDGLSGSLTSGADQVVFRSLRSMADVVLVGAATIRAERYTPMRPAEELQRRRERHGLGPAPVIAVVSGSLDLPWEEPMWSSSVLQPIVLTGAGADPARLAEAQQHAEVITLPGTMLDVRAVVAALEGRGLRRMLCEGGARMLGQLIEKGLLDEADLTLAPLFTGTGVTPSTPAVVPPGRFELVHSLHEGSYQMLRYIRATP